MSQENDEERNSIENVSMTNEEDVLLERSAVEAKKTNLKKEAPKWIDNQGNEVEEVFGFNQNAELVNGRAAMFGFLMLILTELVFKGVPASKSIFGIG